jgi:hypothetical protein
MPAGESAWQEAERRRAAADRHHAKAEALRRQAQAFAKGAAGEAVTARVLDRLVPDGWLRIEDRRWPERVRANVDHIVVGPGGVFVIDSKNWSVTPQVRAGVLVAGGRRREREVAAAAEAAIAVSAVVPVEHRDVVVPVICFVSDAPVAGVARGVLVCSTATVEQMLRTRPRVLSPDAVADVASAVLAGTQCATARPVRAAAVRRRRPQAARSRTRRQRSSRARRSARREVLAVVLLLAFVVLVTSGTYGRLATDAARTVSERLEQQVSERSRYPPR